MEPTPYLVSVFGFLITTVGSLSYARLSELCRRMRELNGQLTNHVQTPSIHEAAFARTDEQIKSLTRVVELAHNRIDAIKGKG